MDDKFIIIDWHGNVISNEEFEEFEDAWEWIWVKFPDERDWEDLYVERKSNVKRL